MSATAIVNRRMCNMYLGLLDKHGIEISNFADRTGKYNIT